MYNLYKHNSLHSIHKALQLRTNTGLYHYIYIFLYLAPIHCLLQWQLNDDNPCKITQWSYIPEHNNRFYERPGSPACFLTCLLTAKSMCKQIIVYESFANLITSTYFILTVVFSNSFYRTNIFLKLTGYTSLTQKR